MARLREDEDVLIGLPDTVWFPLDGLRAAIDELRSPTADTQIAHHPLGDFPANFFQFFQHTIADDLSGKTV